MEKGDTVTLPCPLMMVISVQYDRDTGKKQLLCAWRDGEDTHHRFFREDELVKVEDKS